MLAIPLEQRRYTNYASRRTEDRGVKPATQPQPHVRKPLVICRHKPRSDTAKPTTTSWRLARATAYVVATTLSPISAAGEPPGGVDSGLNANVGVTSGESDSSRGVPLGSLADSEETEEKVELGTYANFLGTISLGESLRFNNPFRLREILGETGESVSRTPLYGVLGLGAAFGNPNWIQHGFMMQWSVALSGIPQSVLTPSYTLIVDGMRPWLLFGRLGVPIVLNPDPGAGGEAAVGGAFLMSAGLGLCAELVGDVFYGAATWEKRITVIPMLSFQFGVIVDFEMLP